MQRFRPLLRLATAVAAIAAAGSCAAQSSPRMAFTLAKDARVKYDTKCVMGDVSACDELLKGYQQAAEAPDATAQDRHDLFKFELEAIGYRGDIELKAGRFKQAIEILQPAFVHMRQHNADGKHFHTLVDGQAVMRHLVMALHGDGRRAEADGLTRQVRAVGDAAWGSQEQLLKTDWGKRMLADAAMGAETFERGLGDNYVALLNRYDIKPAVPMNMSRDEIEPRLLEAYTRAAEWAVRKEEKIGVGNMMDAPPKVRFATYKNWTGFLLAKGGKKEDAASEYLMSANAVCDLAERANDAKASIERAWGQEAKPLCDEATLGYAKLTLSEEEKKKIMADALKERSKQFEKMYKEQLKMWESSGRN